MLMRNEMDRYTLAHDALTRVADGSDRFAELLSALTDARTAAREYAYANGEDSEVVGGWEFTGWPQDAGADGGTGGDPGEGESEGAAPGE